MIADRDPPTSVLAHAAADGRAAACDRPRFRLSRAPGETGGAAERAMRALLPLPPFGGDEQFANAAACATVVDCLANELPVDDDALAAGIRNAYLRGRLERRPRRRRRVGVRRRAQSGRDRDLRALARAPAARAAARSRCSPRCATRISRACSRRSSTVVDHLVRDAGERRARRDAAHELARRCSNALGARCGRRSRPTSQLPAPRRAPPRTPATAFSCSDRFITVGAATAALGLYCAPSRLGDRPAKWTRV